MIDKKFHTNLVSASLVERKGLPTLEHPKPYQLQCSHDCIEVKEQVEVAISIGRYEDKILCDMVPMSIAHILLGQPWQATRKAIHNEHKNRYSLVCNGKKFTLASLSPKEAYEDQLILQKREKEKRDEGEVEKNREIKEKREYQKEKGEVEMAEKKSDESDTTHERDESEWKKESMCESQKESLREELVRPSEKTSENMSEKRKSEEKSEDKRGLYAKPSLSTILYKGMSFDTNLNHYSSSVFHSLMQLKESKVNSKEKLHGETTNRPLNEDVPRNYKEPYTIEEPFELREKVKQLSIRSNASCGNPRELEKNCTLMQLCECKF